MAPCVDLPRCSRCACAGEPCVVPGDSLTLRGIKSPDTLLERYEQAAGAIQQWVVAVPPLPVLLQELLRGGRLPELRSASFEDCVKACEDSYTRGLSASDGDDAD